MGSANTFSSGIFLSVALLHLFPEAEEMLSFDKDEHKANSYKKHYPYSFIFVFIGYTIILALEKIVFDNHLHHNHNQMDDSSSSSSFDDNDQVNQENEREISEIKEDSRISESSKFRISLTKLPKTLLSISALSNDKDERINEYLEAFKSENEISKEEQFKSLFTNNGKINSLISDFSKILNISAISPCKTIPDTTRNSTLKFIIIYLQ